MKGLKTFINLLVYFAAQGSTYIGVSLYKVDNPYTTLWSSTAKLTTYYSQGSNVQCAARCLEQNNTCSAIWFETNNGICTLGKCAITQPVNRSATVDLYQITLSSCNSTPGFNVETNGHTTACLWWSTTRRNFIDAVADCKAKGSTLATFKTLEKFKLLQQKKTPFYIGLDDMAVEGVYRWHDDGTVLNMTYGQQLFRPNEPNNVNNEGCIGIWDAGSNIFGLNDFGCSSLVNYVCEKTCFG